jgi:hypothetical protein
MILTPIEKYNILRSYIDNPSLRCAIVREIGRKNLDNWAWSYHRFGLGMSKSRLRADGNTLRPMD